MSAKPEEEIKKFCVWRFDNKIGTCHFLAFAELLDAPKIMTATYTKTAVKRYNSALNTVFLLFIVNKLNIEKGTHELA